MEYLSHNPGILPHIMTMAVCSAVGQLFIFHTIKSAPPPPRPLLLYAPP